MFFLMLQKKQYRLFYSNCFLSYDDYSFNSALCVIHIFERRLGYENISTTILPLPLILEEQLSVTGERMCTKYW